MFCHCLEKISSLTSDDCRKEDGVAVQHRVDPKLPSSEQPDLPVLEGENRILFIQLIVKSSLSLKASYEKSAFVIVQIPSSAGLIREHEPDNSTEKDGGNTWLKPLSVRHHSVKGNY